MVSFSKPAQECRIGPIGHTQDTKNTFSKLLWLPCRLLPDYLSQNGSICGQSDHSSIILPANPIYMVLWTTLHSLSKCLDRTPWKTLCKWVLYMVQCLLGTAFLVRAHIFLLTCVLRYLKLGTQNWNILNLIRLHMLAPDCFLLKAGSSYLFSLN